MFENKDQLPTTPAEAKIEADALKIEIEQDKKNLEAKINAHESINTENQIKKEALLQQLIDEGAPQETIEFMKRSISLDKEKEENKQKDKTEKIDDVKSKIQEIYLRKDAKLSASEMVNRFLNEYSLAGKEPKEFERLSEYQKLFVVQNLKKRIVDIVKNDTETQYSEYLKEKLSSEIPPNGMLRKIAAGINSARINMIEGLKKESELKNLESEALKGLMNTETGKNLVAQDFEILIKGAIDKKITYREDEGKFFVLHLTPNDIKDCTPEEGEAVFKFNEVANKFREMPYEWGQENKTILGGNKRKYEKAKKEYEKARIEILNIKATRDNSPQDREESLLEISAIDSTIKMEQLLNTHPEFQREFDRLSETASTKEGWKTFGKFLNTFSGKNWTNRGLIFAGAGIRMGAKGAALASNMTGMTALITPIVGGFIGSMRGKIRGKETIKGKEKDARYGKQINDPEIQKVSDAENLTERMDTMILALENASTEEEKQGYLDQVMRRIEFTKGKIEMGLVNFGDTKSTLGNQYNLIDSLNRAIVASSSLENTTRKDIDQRLSAFLLNKKEKVDEAQSKFIKKQMLKGAAIGAGFATFGYAARWFGEHVGWWGNLHEISKPGYIHNNESLNMNSGHETITTPNQQVPIPTEHNIVTADVKAGHGSIATIHELKEKLRVEYPEGSEMPASVQHILNTKDDRLAIEFGMFKPGQNVINESAMTKIGGGFDVDRDGNVIYHQTDGDAGTLLEKGVDAKGTGVYEGKMFDSDHTERNIGNIQKENVSSEYDKYHTETDTESPKTDLGEPKLNTGDELKVQEEYMRTHANAKIEEGGYKTSLSQSREEDIKPMEGKFDNSNGTNTETISPVTGNYNTGANAGETMYHTDASTGPNTQEGNGFTKEVKMTNVAEAESRLQNTRTIEPGRRIYNDGSRIDNSYGSKEIINNKGTLDAARFEADPRHLDNAGDVRKAFGRSNVLMDKPDNDIINGINYKEWNRATDNLFKEKDIKFNSYGDYEKEKALQEFFGHGKHGIQYDPKLDKRVAGTLMYYFRESEEWPTINKIPAKYFFDFKDANLPAEDIKILVNAGVLKENISMFGVHSYSFSHQEELVRMAKIYNKFDPLNSDPLGDESIERYVGRITKELHKTNDGTLYIFKKEASDIESSLDKGTFGKIEHEKMSLNNMQGRSPNIIPRANVYQSRSEYNPNSPLAEGIGRILGGGVFNFNSFTHKVPMTNRF